MNKYAYARLHARACTHTYARTHTHMHASNKINGLKSQCYVNITFIAMQLNLHGHCRTWTIFFCDRLASRDKSIPKAKLSQLLPQQILYYLSANTLRILC